MRGRVGGLFYSPEVNDVDRARDAETKGGFERTKRPGDTGGSSVILLDK